MDFAWLKQCDMEQYDLSFVSKSTERVPCLRTLYLENRSLHFQFLYTIGKSILSSSFAYILHVCARIDNGTENRARMAYVKIQFSDSTFISADVFQKALGAHSFFLFPRIVEKIVFNSIYNLYLCANK